MTVHSSFYKPRVFPYNGNITSAEIDRLQELSGTLTLNREKINEIGRDGTVGYKVGIPQLNLTGRQLEYGSIEFWNKICNKGNSNTDISQTDFDTTQFDIAGYATDNSGTYLGSIWYPKLRTSGFSINIGDPDAFIERNFTFIGEDELQWTGNNKYLIEFIDTSSAGASHTLTFGSGVLANYPDPVADPESSGDTFFIRMVRTRSGVTTELVEGTDFTYDDGTDTISFVGAVSAASDTFKFIYTATTYVSGGDPFTNNDVDEAAISADSCTVLLQTSNTLTRVQSVSAEISFDRQDLKEVGNSEVVSRGIRERTVTINLGRLLESNTIEELLAGNVAGYGKVNPRNYLNTNSLIIKVYSDSTKTTFKMGYKFTNLAPSSQETGVPTKDFVNRALTFTGEELFITNDEGNL